MELKLKFIGDNSYEIEEGFAEGLEKMSPGLAASIVLYLDANLPDLKDNDMTTYIIGGLIHYGNEPITFAVEMMKASGETLTITDVCLIEMDDYLDLINLKSTFEYV